MLLEGIFPPITTPFYPDGRLYLRKLEHNVERYSRSPLAGIVVLGSTGEAIMLSDDESRQVLATAAGAAAPDKVLLAGVARESLSETLRLAEYAADRRYDAVLVRTPHFYSPSYGLTTGAAPLLTYYRALADRSPLPIVLYNIPKFTQLDLPVAVVAELAHHPNIIAIKDSSGPLDRLAALLAATRNAPKRTVTVTPTFTAVTSRMMLAEAEADFIPVDVLGTDASLVSVIPPPPRARATRTREVGFQVLTGVSSALLPALEMGASGAVPAFAVPAPQTCQEIYIAWKENDLRIAREKQDRIANAQHVVGQYGIPGIKYACDLNGYYGGVPRVPLLPLTADQQLEVAAAMADARN